MLSVNCSVMAVEGVYEPLLKRAKTLTTSFGTCVSKYDKIIIIILRNPEGESFEDDEILTTNANRLQTKLIRKGHNVEIIEYDSAKDISLKSKCTSKTKIVISGHGCVEMNELAGRTAQWIAEIIYNDLEIEQAKTITLLSCNLGNSTFPKELKNELFTESNGDFMPKIHAFTLPIMLYENGEIIADKGENDESDELELVPAKNYKVRF